MIKSLKIQNFQSHADTKLEFAPGVNVIVGTSDSGKTSIIRAIRWLVWNRPSGDALRSTWGGETNVRLETEDGTIVRSKDKVDKYLLLSADKGSIEFKAIGTSVPEEVQGVLNISEINLQGQLDAPFLLSESPGAVAAHFNRVAGLDKIDEATSRVNAWIRTLTQDSAYKATTIEKHEEELKQFDYLDAFELDIEALEALERETQNKRTALRKLQGVIDELRVLNKDIEEQQAAIKHETAVNILLGKFGDRAAFRRTCDTLERLVGSIAAAGQTLLKTQKKAQELEAQFHKFMPDVCPLCDTILKKK